MTKIRGKKRLMLVTFALTSSLHMPIMALNTAVEHIASDVFPQRTLAEIQTAQSSLNLVIMFFALLAAFLSARGILSKKTIAVTGLVLFGSTGLVAAFLHSQFWHLWLYSVLIGGGCGFFIPSMTSLIFDHFSPAETRLATGVQSAAVNVGGIAFGAFGGILTAALWYGGYLLELVALPVALLALFAMPGKKAAQASGAAARGERTKLPVDVLYYGLAMLIFFMLYIACGSNISTHLARAGIGGPAVAGAASAIQMAGGVASGLLFSRLSARFKDMLVPIAFAVLFTGMTVLNLGYAFLSLNLVGVFLVGVSLSIIFPQCIFSTSRRVDATNSVTGTTVVQAVAPGLGGFISPLILTNLTMALGGESTRFRYQFVGFLALALAAVFYILTLRREKRAGGDMA